MKEVPKKKIDVAMLAKSCGAIKIMPKSVNSLGTFAIATGFPKLADATKFVDQLIKYEIPNDRVHVSDFGYSVRFRYNTNKKVTIKEAKFKNLKPYSFFQRR